MNRMVAALAACAFAASCGGETGLLRIQIVTAPGSDLPDRIELARATLSNPLTVTDAERDPDGNLELDLEVEAAGQGAFLTVEGFDAANNLIAVGYTPPLPIAAIDADISIYLAPPQAFDRAPVDLMTATTDIGGDELPFGAILVGGTDTDGQATTDLTIYNAYDHDLQIGLELPAARRNMTVLAGLGDSVYLFGGIDDDGTERSEAWRFDTGVAPAGLYAQLASNADLARAGASGARIGADSFVIAGNPPAVLDLQSVRALPDSPDTTGGIAVELSSGTAPPVFIAGAGVGASGAVRFTGSFTELAAPEDILRFDHSVVPLTGDRVAVIGGVDAESNPLASAVTYHPFGDTFEVQANVLSSPRAGAAIARAGAVIVVAGGRDATGTLRADAELIAADTLESLGTVALVAAREDALLLPLPNGQALLAGGTDADGMPVGVLELFSPAP